MCAYNWDSITVFRGRGKVFFKKKLIEDKGQIFTYR